ncbi:MAG: hypothetical protein ABEH66_06620 [Halobacteriales archaeon]
MSELHTEAVAAAREAVPFLVIAVVWIVVMLVLYGLFLATKPNVDYAAWVHASIFLPGLIGYLGHTLRQALSVLAE